MSLFVYSNLGAVPWKNYGFNVDAIIRHKITVGKEENKAGLYQILRCA